MQCFEKIVSPDSPSWKFWINSNFRIEILPHYRCVEYDRCWNIFIGNRFRKNACPLQNSLWLRIEDTFHYKRMLSSLRVFFSYKYGCVCIWFSIISNIFLFIFPTLRLGTHFVVVVWFFPLCFVKFPPLFVCSHRSALLKKSPYFIYPPISATDFSLYMLSYLRSAAMCHSQSHIEIGQYLFNMWIAPCRCIPRNFYPKSVRLFIFITVIHVTQKLYAAKF